MKGFRTQSAGGEISESIEAVTAALLPSSDRPEAMHNAERPNPRRPPCEAGGQGEISMSSNAKPPKSPHRHARRRCFGPESSWGDGIGGIDGRANGREPACHLPMNSRAVRAPPEAARPVIYPLWRCTPAILGQP